MRKPPKHKDQNLSESSAPTSAWLVGAIVGGIVIGALVAGLSQYCGLSDNEYSRHASHSEGTIIAAFIGACNGGLLALFGIVIWCGVSFVRRRFAARARKKLALKVFESRQAIAQEKCPAGVANAVMKDVRNE